MYKKSFLLFVLLLTLLESLAQTTRQRDIFIQEQNTNEDYQKYIGKTVIFYDDGNEYEKRCWDFIRNYNRSILTETPYVIQEIKSKGRNINIWFVEKNNVKSKKYKVFCMNEQFRYNYIGYMPLYFPEELEKYTDDISKNILGRNVIIDGVEYTITNAYSEFLNNTKGKDREIVTNLVYVNEQLDTVTEDITIANGGIYYSELSKVEKPSNSSIRYGETTSIIDSGITKFSYRDDVVDITIFGDSTSFQFIISNISDNTIKMVWNEAVFVGIDGQTSKIMHKGIKYSQKEGDQPTTVIIKGAKLSDVAVPTSNVQYDGILSKWVTYSMYPSQQNMNGQVRLMLPIQIKENINEYVFYFDIKWKWNRPELH